MEYDVDKHGELIEFPLDDTYLKTRVDEFDFSNPFMNPVILSNSLTMTREKLQGLGLAANQVGLNTRVISVKGIDSCLFNPLIVHTGGKPVLHEEGCLTFPNLIVKVKRNDFVRVRFQNASGEGTIKSFYGMTARIIQHEIDHLDGIIFTERASRYHRELAYRKRRKIEKRSNISNSL